MIRKSIEEIADAWNTDPTDKELILLLNDMVKDDIATVVGGKYKFRQHDLRVYMKGRNRALKNTLSEIESD